ncbi:hypothetical protein ACEXQE_14410 [Herbiconiux sp. P17]|uniref:hypothetical protein n=1 Tax=Herbiconiux wuyangfengii TaxID=3342794 RepID=UPI0035B95025
MTTAPAAPPRRRALSTGALWGLLASTPLLLLLTHYLAAIPHEFTHSFVAWMLGIKSDPLVITWGGDSIANILLLIDIDEHVDYKTALADGRFAAVAITALAGPLLANGGLYLIWRWVIGRAAVRARPVLSYVVFWLLVMNLANIWCYIPMRAFASNGDFVHFIWATNASPWLMYIIVGYLVVWGLFDFYRRVLPCTLEAATVTPRPARAIVLIVATAVIFGYFAIPGFVESDPVSQVIAGTSVLLIPPIVLLQWGRAVVEPLGRAASGSGSGSVGR